MIKPPTLEVNSLYNNCLKGLGKLPLMYSSIVRLLIYLSRNQLLEIVIIKNPPHEASFELSNFTDCGSCSIPRTTFHSR